MKIFIGGTSYCPVLEMRKQRGSGRLNDLAKVTELPVAEVGCKHKPVWLQGHALHLCASCMATAWSGLALRMQNTVDLSLKTFFSCKRLADYLQIYQLYGKAINTV